MRLEDFDFELPEELIAQHPLPERSSSRLLCLNSRTGNVSHRMFNQVVDVLPSDTLLVMNNTRVTAVRLFGNRTTGGAVEFLLLKPTGKYAEFVALTRPAKKLKSGESVQFSHGLTATICADIGEGMKRIEFTSPDNWQEVLRDIGRVPLPPYITEELQDSERYQTIFAKEPGSSAAPTAGLHFTDEILNQLRAKGINTVEVTLDVGLDTFRPIQTVNVLEHLMHGETCQISESTAQVINEATGPIIAVGTTTTRTLESFAVGERKVKAGYINTNIFLHPENKPRIVTGLFTNFHMPRTTMLLMLASFTGVDALKSAYSEAIGQRYRFLSFGDSMLIAPFL